MALATQITPEALGDVRRVHITVDLAANTYEVSVSYDQHGRFEGFATGRTIEAALEAAIEDLMEG